MPVVNLTIGPRAVLGNLGTLALVANGYCHCSLAWVLDVAGLSLCSSVLSTRCAGWTQSSWFLPLGLYSGQVALLPLPL